MVSDAARRDAIYRRDAHPKHHGVVKAWFTVADNVPEELRHGIFAMPQTFAAWIRFSNGAPTVNRDSFPDVRGFAIKLMGVPGAKLSDDEHFTQDFLLASAPRFFIRSLDDYLVFSRQVLKKPAIRVLGFFFGLNPRKWRRYEFSALRQTSIRIPNVLTQRYWSQSAYRLGPHVVKYSVVPTSPDLGLKATKSPNYLRDNLATHLRIEEASFDFCIQRQTYPAAMPIEDPTVVWQETAAPFHKVATIRIPVQEFQTAAQMNLAENIGFSPWHALAEHEPIGWPNRARRVVYATISSFRRAKNGVTYREPLSHDDIGEQPVLPYNAVVPSPPKRGVPLKKIAASLAVLALLGLAWLIWPVTKTLPVQVVQVMPLQGSNGLSQDEREIYYHLSEGGEVYPISWLLALEQAVATPEGPVVYRPFLENIERFGLIPDATTPRNPYGLPVGVSVGNSKITGMQMMGVNCTMCHVGEVHYKGTAIRVDGAPTMGYVNAFLTALADETKATFASPTRLARFLNRRRHVETKTIPKPSDGDEDVVPDSAFKRTETDGDFLFDFFFHFASKNGLLTSKAASLKTLDLVTQAMAIGTPDGPGRIDAFGNGRNELFGGYETSSFVRGMNATPTDAPVSIPHLWGMQYTSWFQYGVNTNSVIERNIGQALGVGATFDPAHGYTSTVRLDHLNTMEQLSYKLTAPQWPAIFPQPDPDRVRKGRAFFDQTCALCHESYNKYGSVNEYQLFPLDIVGTDPAVAVNFERNVMTAQGPKPFGKAAFEIVNLVKAKYFEEHKVPLKTQQEWEAVATRGQTVYRTPLRDYEDYPDTKNHGIYRAKTLKGIWATAPYLHNGSVPTIWDLLQTADKRPTTFQTGTHEYDTAKLGYYTDGPGFLLPAGMTPFLFDTHLTGNSNAGHEWWFYETMTDEDRWNVIEFLKTYNPPNEVDYHVARPPNDKLPPDVRMRYPLPLVAPKKP